MITNSGGRYTPQQIKGFVAARKRKEDFENTMIARRYFTNEQLDFVKAMTASQIASTLGLGTKSKSSKEVELIVPGELNGARGYRGKDGNTIWTFKENGEIIGNNVQFTMKAHGLTFVQAINMLLSEIGIQGDVGLTHPNTMPYRVVRLPTDATRRSDIGKAYLLGRSINPEAIEIAENQGLLMYIFNAILFIGYDGDNQIKSATRRLIKPAPGEKSKSDLPGSRKGEFPAMIHGSQNDVWIVEGGLDALALLCMRDLWADANIHPSIIISGGAGVRAWIQTPHINTLLKDADITVAYENEKDEATQIRTDAQHDKQCDALMAANVKSVSKWRPSFGKDLADFLERKNVAQ